VVFSLGRGGYDSRRGLGTLRYKYSVAFHSFTIRHSFNISQNVPGGALIDCAPDILPKRVTSNSLFNHLFSTTQMVPITRSKSRQTAPKRQSKRHEHDTIKKIDFIRPMMTEIPPNL
jgi:hypothetical protein